MPVIVVKLYSLEINGKVICEVTAELPAWMRVKPQLDKRWLRGMINAALAEYFEPPCNISKREVVKA